MTLQDIVSIVCVMFALLVVFRGKAFLLRLEKRHEESEQLNRRLKMVSRK